MRGYLVVEYDIINRDLYLVDGLTKEESLHRGLMKTVFRDGSMKIESFSTIRDRVNSLLI